MKGRSLNRAFMQTAKLVKSGDLPGVIDLIKEVPALKEFTDGDHSLISLALDAGRSFMHALLIEGVNPDLTDTTGSTLLMDSASLGNFDIVKLLLNHGASANKANMSGETAFSFACARGNLECAKLLYENGADINIRIGYSGSRPLDWAERFSSDEFIGWMREIGALRGCDC